MFLGETCSVIAIVKAKRFSKDKEKGRVQAQTYTKGIKR